MASVNRPTHPGGPNVYAAPQAALIKASQPVGSHVIDVFEPLLRLYPVAVTARLRADRAAIAAGSLHPWCGSYVALAQTPRSHGLVLLLHGFSAGPWQYDAMVQQFTRAGVDVYVPRLPGHGHMREGKADPSKLPSYNASHAYGHFADSVVQEAHELAQLRGVPLHVLGFSLGGAMALDLTRRHATKVSRLMLVAPFLRPRPMNARLAHQLLRVGKVLQVGKTILRRYNFSWGPQPPPWEQSVPLPGYWTFQLGALYACIGYARRVHARVRNLAMPVQLVVSGADQSSDPALAVKLLRRVAPQHQVLSIDARENVTHSMLAEMTLDGPQRVTKLARDFLCASATQRLPLQSN